tara:strand:+ start:425 stop:688 length:264 start_codon:yes stop_codon:yes gene_type:complete
MFIITLKDQPSGIYSVFNYKSDRIIPIFEAKDDAVRYLFHLTEDDDTPDLEVVEVDHESIVLACRSQGQKFSVITVDDFIIPPADLE